MSEILLPMFSSSFFMVSGLTFKSLIHFEFILVCGLRRWSSFIFLHVSVQFSQHHLLNKLSLFPCVCLPPLWNINWLKVWVYLWDLYCFIILSVLYVQYHVICKYNFTSSFPIWKFLFLFVWFLWLGLPVLCWIRKVNVDTLVLFILRAIFVVFVCWVWCCQWVCFIWPLLCLDMFLLFLLCWEFWL